MDALLEHAVRCSLVDYLDQRVLVVLRDGKKFVGFLRSFDQYSNLVIENPVERTVVGNCYHDEPVDSMVLLIRSDNLVIMCTVDEERQSQQKDFKEVSKEELARLQEDAGSAELPVDLDEDLVV